MMIPAELKYTKDHEWVRVEGNTATIGITDHAQKELGDIVFLDLPKGAGTAVSKGDPLGTVESVKTLSDVYAPISGTVVEVNSALTSSPEQVNEEPYGVAWMVKLTLGDPSELDGLMSASDYEAYLATQEH